MSTDTVIEVENLSKQYRLGEISTGSLGHDLNRWWHRVRGKEDPYLSITGENIRTRRRERKPKADAKANPSSPAPIPSDYVWALKDIAFEVKRGEVLGIIGRNGAGKSTLLKILSRVTAPTLGEIRVQGRIASLLEVGTGFHQDLTGRENIFLNGAILGMTKQEIQNKLDEIVDFSGCETYLDTPVKRYSSGMVVRLGFAVAAHLEPEILIVDEVLAVGDAEFQKKCIGKMQDVASGGRTVFIVSHNMGMINQLCDRALVIQEGHLVFSGDTEKAIEWYYSMGSGVPGPQHFRGPASGALRLSEVGINGQYAGRFVVRPAQDITITVRGAVHEAIDNFQFVFGLFHNGVLLCSCHDLPTGTRLARGEFETTVTIPAYFLRPGDYEIGFGGEDGKSIRWLYSNNIGLLTVLEEWDADCDKRCPGFINLPKDKLRGARRMLSLE